MNNRSSRKSSQAVAIFFVAIILAGLVVSVIALVGWQPESPPADDPAGPPTTLDMIIGGSISERIENELESGLPLRSAAVRVMATLKYLLLRSGNDGVVVGRDGWLYTREEFEHHRSDRSVLGERLAFIAGVNARLEDMGIVLVVALVPSKARIVQDPLPARWAKLADHSRYEEALCWLSGRSIRAVDLRATLGTAPELFLKADTHWTPLGARLAARAIADAVDGVEQAARTAYETQSEDEIEVLGDLMSFVPVGPIGDRLGLAAQTVVPSRTAETAAPSLGLFDVPTIPVTLVGTSYSADPRWNFVGELRQALGLDVLNISTEAVGPFEPMGEYLTGSALSEVRPGAVVWELPERYLTLPAIRVPEI